MNIQYPRSPYDQVHGLVYFGRMLDKIRLHAAGNLSADYIPNLGIKLDTFCVHFLGVNYQALVDVIIAGASDEEAWEWCAQHGKPHSQEELFIWNAFMTKRGWRDDVTPILHSRLKESGYEHRTDIETIFEYMDLDEGRVALQ